MVPTIPESEIDPSLLGAFDYAHLRAPLPRGISSGIFKSSPSSYFLMRRSSDGFVSATGMFKATFPWAEMEEEDMERKYVKSLPTTSPDETAGNVWIPPESALDLADEYGIVAWIKALLDPADIPVGAPTDAGPPKEIRAPPKYFGAQPQPLPLPDLGSPPSTVSRNTRSRRSASPTKVPAPKRSVASPRKRRHQASQTSTETPPGSAHGSFDTLVNDETPSQVPIPVTPSSTQTTKMEAVDDEIKVSRNKEPAPAPSVEDESKLKLHCEEDVKADEDGEEMEHPKAEIGVPLYGEIPPPEDAARIIAEAKEMVRVATQAQAAHEEDEAAEGEGASQSKRKANDDEDDGEGTEVARRTKRVKTAVETRKDGMKKRAFYGIGATLAFGYVLATLSAVRR